MQDDRWAKYQHTQSILEAERRRLRETHLRTADLRTAMEAAGLAPAAEGGIAEELLSRPEISYPLLAGVIGWGEQITPCWLSGWRPRSSMRATLPGRIG